MTRKLRSQAHAELNRGVEKFYRPKRSDNDRQRVESLFTVNEKLTAPMTASMVKPKTVRRSKQARLASELICGAGDSLASASGWHLTGKSARPTCHFNLDDRLVFLHAITCA